MSQGVQGELKNVFSAQKHHLPLFAVWVARCAITQPKDTESLRLSEAKDVGTSCLF